MSLVDALLTQRVHSLIDEIEIIATGMADTVAKKDKDFSVENLIAPKELDPETIKRVMQITFQIQMLRVMINE